MQKHIQPRKRGNQFGIWFFRILMQAAGLRGAYALLYPVCMYYALFDHQAVQSAMPYIDRRFPNLPAVGKWWTAYRLFIAQGKNLIDRHALVAEAVEFDTAVEGYKQVQALSDDQKGFILLTSHVGNWQTVMHSLAKFERPVHVLMRPEENEALREAVRVDAEGSCVRIISPDQELGGVLAVLQALENGDIVAIMGDRTYGADSVKVNFLRDTAYFPYSAFHIAATSNFPIVVLLSSKTGVNSYSVRMADILRPEIRRGADRREQLREWVQRYADILGNYLLAHPLQYFIFNDIWADSDPSEG